MPPDRTSDPTERCPACERERPHDVWVEMITENPASSNAVYSREPYRIARCQHCGERHRTRLSGGRPRSDHESLTETVE